MKLNSNSLNRLSNTSDRLKTLIKAGLCVSFAVILGVTILLQLGGFPFLFAVNFFLLRYLPAFIALLAVICAFIFLRKKSPAEKIIVERITPAQIEALLNADNRLTASRLAKATNVSEEYAKKFLDAMVVEGKLTTSTNDSYELVYSRNLLL
jgi:predicted transcriptional regulator